MPVNRPKKPARPAQRGRRRSTAVIPPATSIFGPQQATEGYGSRFAEARLTGPDLGHGLPKAPSPIIATTPAEIRARASQKRYANTRTSAANNVRGYVQPGLATQRGPLPSAEQLLEMTGSQLGATTRPLEMPTADDLLRLTSEQLTPAPDVPGEGTYLFPQVAPTKTINPLRPRTLEAGYEKNTGGPGLGTLRVRFRDGTPWEYYNVPPSVWQRFKRVKSPGRFVNRVLNSYPYGRGDF